MFNREFRSMGKNEVIEVMGLSVNEILEEFIFKNKFNSEWFKDNLLKDIIDGNLLLNNNEGYWLWLLNNSVVGYSFLRKGADCEVWISFRVKDYQDLSEELLQRFVDETVFGSFSSYQLEKIFYDCGERCSTPISRTFIKNFKPHPIGWVHLNHGKFVLTRGQVDQTEVEFYKI